MERKLTNTNIPYSIRISKRAVYARIVANHNNIEVAIPAGTPLKYAEDFAEKKRNWIIKKYNELNLIQQISKSHINDEYKNKSESELKVELKKMVKDIIVNNHEELGRPNQVRIKKQKTRWGSCSTKGSININLNLIYAPQNVLEYVVVHELCHMTHMNHSKEFWNLVEKALPNYKLPRQWLKQHGQSLMAAS